MARIRLCELATRAHDASVIADMMEKKTTIHLGISNTKFLEVKSSHYDALVRVTPLKKRFDILKTPYNPQVKHIIQRMIKDYRETGSWKVYCDEAWSPSKAVTAAKWIRSFTIKPPVFYHGSLHIHVPTIMKFGLLPRKKRKGVKGWGGDYDIRLVSVFRDPKTGKKREVRRYSGLKTEDMVYLTAEEKHAQAAAEGASKKTRRYTGEYGVPVIFKVHLPSTDRLYPDDDNKAPTWVASLRSRGAAVAHRGRIPAKFLKPYKRRTYRGWVPWEPNFEFGDFDHEWLGLKELEDEGISEELATAMSETFGLEDTDDIIDMFHNSYRGYFDSFETFAREELSNWGEDIPQDMPNYLDYDEMEDDNFFNVTPIEADHHGVYIFLDNY